MKPKTSWKTTTLGIIGALTMLLAEGRAAFDDDPNTQPSVENIVTALSILGIGLFARDNNRTSEDVKAK